PVTPPIGVIPGHTFARCRISTLGGLATTGLALDGEVEDHMINLEAGFVQWCQLDYPVATTTQVGIATEMTFGQVYHTNMTDSAGQGAGIFAEFGYGPDGADPTTNDTIWTWSSASYNPGYVHPQSDGYKFAVTIGSTGRYDYAYRFSRNGADWSYGDLDSSTNGYSVAQAGDLLVFSDADDGGPGCAKWRQPPDCQFGLDLPTYTTYDGDTNNVYRLADDWWCDGRPITGIRWWGSYVGNDSMIPSAAIRPDAFILRWYTDVPEGTGGSLYGEPGNVIKEVLVSVGTYGFTNVPQGVVSENYFCTVWKATNTISEHEYEYCLELDDDWVEKEGNIYWLNIEAVYNGTVASVTNGWGWLTSSEYNRLSDAVVWEDGMTPGDWHELTWPGYPLDKFFTGYNDFNEPTNSPSLDMAFEMLTDVCPARCKKWEQPPDMASGKDKESWRKSSQNSDYELRGDDFVSDGRLISDVHWWGSYIGWMSNTVGSVTNPVPWPTNASSSLVGFELNWYTDVASAPGVVLTNTFVPVDDCYQVFYGTVTNGDGSYEQEYQYYADLMDMEGPWYGLAGTQYWITIQAVLPDSYVPAQAGYDGWGWLTTTQTSLWTSVVSSNAIMWNTSVPAVDLAFELTTTDIPETNSPFYDPVEVLSLEFTGSGGEGYIVTTGGVACGVQVLQETTNLLTTPTSWEDVATNSLPNPSSFIWRGTPVDDMLFYRIMQRNN
ncbi:MAG: hypothetical protein KAI74_03265, partial [Kiritimatiellae bacterium]|nr:hypothetical protein [Kiritimatiellia bacterium]